MAPAVYHLDPKDCPKAPKVNCALYIVSEIAPISRPETKRWQEVGEGLLFCLFTLGLIYLLMSSGRKELEKEKEVSPSLSTPPIYGEWLYLNETNQYYLAVEGYFDFDGCRDLCVQNGSQMVSIHSDIENEFVFNISTTWRMDGDHNDCTWIGMRRCQIIRPDGAPGWCNVDGTPADYTHWDTYNGHPEPNNSDGFEDCVEIYSDKSCPQKLCRAKWNDIDCDWKHRMCVCKKDAL